MKEKNIRNFAIVAHIDHGKSTLADRFLELTGTIEKRKMREQFLDAMELERERGITIKMQPVRMIWSSNHPKIRNSNIEIRNKSKIQNSNNQKSFGFRASDFGFSNSRFILNLIDTPGHVDFSYEVSRALAAVEGVVLLVDATKGVQAQTLANVKIAIEQELVVIPAVNKIDLPQARPKEVRREIEDMLLSLDVSKLLPRRNSGQVGTSYLPDTIFEISAKTGEGVEELLNAVVEKIPPPLNADRESAFRALVFDSVYDAHKGIVAHVRVVGGSVSRHDTLVFYATGVEVAIKELGYFAPEPVHTDELREGEIGYIATGIKYAEKIKIGDTIINADQRGLHAALGIQPLAGYQEPQPLVFASVFPESSEAFGDLKNAVSKLNLNDSSLSFEIDYSESFGRGIKFGFLGMLHMEVVMERLRREFGIETIITSPSVVYKVNKKNGEEIEVYTPSKFPDPSSIEGTFEPYASIEILTPQRYFSGVMSLLKSIRGTHKSAQNIGKDIMLLRHEAPLSELITDFYDKLKSVSSGFASLSYELIGFREADVLKMEILLAGEELDALTRIVPRERAQKEGSLFVKKMKEIIPQEQFAVAIQARVGGKIIARETKSAMKKDVTGYLYGGDYTRKRKLLEKQKKGKKRLRERGRVHLDPDTFMKLFKQ